MSSHDPLASRVGLFVDASNVHISTRQAYGRYARVNYERLHEFAQSEGQVVAATAFCGFNGNGDHRFFVCLKLLGYEVHYRAARPMPSGEMKADTDAMMGFVIGQATLRRDLQKVIIVTGDSDFQPIVSFLMEQGVEVVVLGPEESTAWELIVSASRFSYLNELGLVDGAEREPEADPNVSLAA